jgi:ribosomal-protein-alanine N-acetyltransferase
MEPYNFYPVPVIETERLTLRQIVASDSVDFYSMRSDEETMRYIPRPVMESLNEAEDLIQRMDLLAEKQISITWGISLKGEERLIGTIGYVQFRKEDFRAEVGYMLHKLFTRKAIMQEALAAILHYGFGIMKLHAVEAVVHPDNVASIRLLERHGFVFKDYIFTRGAFVDAAIYSLIRK